MYYARKEGYSDKCSSGGNKFNICQIRSWSLYSSQLLVIHRSHLYNTQQMQPLQLLRTHTCNKKPVILKDANDNVVTNVADASTVWFDDESFARNTPTTFPKNSSDDTYTLDTLIFLVQNEHLDNSAYFKECRQRDIEHVSIVDRKKVLDYLTGKVDTQPTKQSRSTSGKQNDDMPYFKWLNMIVQVFESNERMGMRSRTKLKATMRTSLHPNESSLMNDNRMYPSTSYENEKRFCSHQHPFYKAIRISTLSSKQ